MDREDLNQVACDYAAGDLLPHEAEAFEKLLQQSQTLKREVAFWQNLSGQLRQHGRPLPARVPSQGFNEVLRHRLQRESQRPLPGPGTAPRWMPGMAAALAAVVCMFIGLGWWRQSTTTSEQAFMSVAHEHMQKFQSWAGLKASPVAHQGHDGQQYLGLQVLQVDPGSHAEELGLRPGDVVLSVDGEATSCSYSLARVLAKRQPGESCRLRVFHPDRALAHEYQLQLGSLQP